MYLLGQRQLDALIYQEEAVALDHLPLVCDLSPLEEHVIPLDG